MKIEEGLENKKKEITDLEIAVNNLRESASKLKPNVSEYNNLMQQASVIKKIIRQKKTEFDTVIKFFESTGENYLDKIFPLFRQEENEEKQENVA